VISQRSESAPDRFVPPDAINDLFGCSYAALGISHLSSSRFRRPLAFSVQGLQEELTKVRVNGTNALSDGLLGQSM
jgi:hypothetical protein